MVMAVLDFVLLQINSLSYSFYNHSLFRILKVFKSMRALRAIRVLRRLRSLPPTLLAFVENSQGKREHGPGFPGVPWDMFLGWLWACTVAPFLLGILPPLRSTHEPLSLFFLGRIMT
jgi:hypothetical protein